jgi:hypothetical protein
MLEASSTPTMKSALPVVMLEFEGVAKTDPERLKTATSADLNRLRFFNRHPHPTDTFGNLGLAAFGAFMDISESVVGNSSPGLLDKLRISKFGIGTIALMAELAPLHHIFDKPAEVPTPAMATNTLANSYGFIDDILQSGEHLGGGIALEYLEPYARSLNTASFNGTLVADKMSMLIRLEKTELKRCQHGGYEVVAVGWDQTMQKALKGSKYNGKAVVSCPAETHKDQATGDPFTRKLFNILTDFVGKHVYPEYIPYAHRVVTTAPNRHLWGME